MNFFIAAERRETHPASEEFSAVSWDMRLREAGGSGGVVAATAGEPRLAQMIKD